LTLTKHPYISNLDNHLDISYTHIYKLLIMDYGYSVAEVTASEVPADEIDRTFKSSSTGS